MPDKDDLPLIVVERRSGGFGSFLIGALIGAGLAVLYAPRSGEQTRREIADGARRLRESAEETARKIQHSVSETIEELREEVTERVDSARQAMDAGREAARATRADLERRVRQAAEATEATEATTPPVDFAYPDVPDVHAHRPAHTAPHGPDESPIDGPPAA